MPSDFGDESGEKLCDWMLKIGQNAGDEAMRLAAKNLISALKKTKGDIKESASSESGNEQRKEWARLSLDEISRLEEYETVKDVIGRDLDDAAIEHEFFHDENTGRDYLIFRIEDAGEVSKAFDCVVAKVEDALEKAKAALEEDKTKEAPAKDKETKSKQARDNRDEPLEERAERVRDSAKALESEKTKTREIGREDRFEEVRTK